MLRICNCCKEPIMRPSTDAEIRHGQWHAATVDRDVDRLTALYSEDAVLETPLILVALNGTTEVILQGRPKVRRSSNHVTRRFWSLVQHRNFLTSGKPGRACRVAGVALYHSELANR
jgi:hypothetical protein